MDDSVLQCFDVLDVTRNVATHKSKAPCSFDVLQRYSNLILGHFTSSVFLSSIRKNGLCPDDKKQRSIDDGLLSDNSSIYLSARFDRFYLDRAVTNHGGSGLIVVVRAPIDQLRPDVNALSESERNCMPFEHQLFSSLQFGACVHRGPILLNRILGIYDERAVALLGHEQG